MTLSPLPRVLITGGLGFIGTKLVEILHGSYEILIVDNLHPQVHEDRSALEAVPSGVEVLEIDVTDQDGMRRAAAFHPDVVFHLAAETGTGQSLLQSRRHAEVNVVGTATLLDALSADRLPHRIVLPSSRAVYGEGHWESRSGSVELATARSSDQLSEGRWTPPPAADGGELVRPVAHDARVHSPSPANVYAATKLAQEHMLRSWGVSLGVSYTICRLQNVFGHGQALGNPYTGVLTFMARQAAAGEEIHVFEGGGIVRDFVNVRDVAAALVSAAFVEVAANEVFDIGSGDGVTLYEVAARLAEQAGAPGPRRTDEYRAGDVRAAFADIRHAADKLGYRPSVPLADGLNELLSWASAVRA